MFYSFCLIHVSLVNCFIVNQSCLDIIVCTVSVLIQYVTSIEQVPEGLAQELACRFWLSTYLLWGFATASGYNLTFLTIERYLAITKPMKYDAEAVRNLTQDKIA